jgi:addiction module HigA family antidote
LTLNKSSKYAQNIARDLFKIIDQKGDISPEMVLRIATVFGRTPDIWLRLQGKYDLEKAAEKIKGFKVDALSSKRLIVRLEYFNMTSCKSKFKLF